MAGAYAPGERLVESRLAEELETSRTPIREALRRLQAEALVEVYPNRGAVVRAFPPEYLEETYGLRAVLEGHAAHEAALRIEASQLALLEDQCQVLESALERSFRSRQDEVEFLVHHNTVFHNTIIEASGNARLRTLVGQVLDVPLHYRSFSWYTPQERQLSNFFHRRVVDALRARDAERAGYLMREHVYVGRDSLLKHMEAGAPSREGER
jgi:DNA-binding GntR family transcriptional regulator